MLWGKAYISFSPRYGLNSSTDWAPEKEYSEFKTLKKTTRNHSTTFSKNSWQFTNIKEWKLWRSMTVYVLDEYKIKNWYV